MSVQFDTLEGGCLCGEIRYRLKAPYRPVLQCHCGQCARWTGYLVAATQVHVDSFELLTGVETLSWYRSSDWAERGFCGTCGSCLFWRQTSEERISILAGTLDRPTGLKTAAHIFASEKSDYYEIGDAAPQYAGCISQADCATLKI